MRNRIKSHILVVVVSLIICLFLTPQRFETYDPQINFILSVIGFLNIISFWLVSTRITGSWIGFETLFLVAFAIVHFQIPFLTSLGIEPNRANYIFIDKRVVNYATWLSVCAMLLWMLGYLLKSYRFLLKHTTFPDLQRRSFSNSLRIVNWLLPVSLLLFIVFVGNEFLSGSYEGIENWGAGANYAYLVLSTLLHLRTIYFFKNNALQLNRFQGVITVIFKNLFFLVILGIYIVLFLVVGDRGPILNVLIVIAISYSIFVKSISFKLFFTSLFIGAVLFTIISAGRTRDSHRRNQGIISSGYENIKTSEDSFIPTAELASSNRILYRALTIIPNEHPYLNGLTFLHNVIGVIPFGSQIYFSIVDVPVMYRSSPVFFTIWGQGIHYTSGEGSEILADIYINFGIYGVFVLMFLFGCVVSHSTKRALMDKNHLYTLTYITLTMGAIYINRSELLLSLKPLFYLFLFDWILIKKNQIK